MVDVQPLSPGAAQVVQLRARAKKGVPAAEREALAASVRAVEQKYSGDALVEAFKRMTLHALSQP